MRISSEINENQWKWKKINTNKWKSMKMNKKQQKQNENELFHICFRNMEHVHHWYCMFHIAVDDIVARTYVSCKTMLCDVCCVDCMTLCSNSTMLLSTQQNNVRKAWVLDVGKRWRLYVCCFWFLNYVDDLLNMTSTSFDISDVLHAFDLIVICCYFRWLYFQ